MDIKEIIEKLEQERFKLIRQADKDENNSCEYLDGYADGTLDIIAYMKEHFIQ